MDTKKTEELTFKDASIELEQIVRKLEGTDLELEESLALYARGVELVKDLRGRRCSQRDCDACGRRWSCGFNLS